MHAIFHAHGFSVMCVDCLVMQHCNKPSEVWP